MRDFGKIRRIIVKVGTNLLSSKNGVDRERIRSIVRQVATLRKDGMEVMLVSSGAVGLGAKAIGQFCRRAAPAASGGSQARLLKRRKNPAVHRTAGFLSYMGGITPAA